MNKGSITKNVVSYQAVGEQIPHSLGDQMVKDHISQNGVGSSFSYSIGKDILLKALSQPGCVGIRLFDGINEVGAKTLIGVGIDSLGKNILELACINEHGKISVTEGMVFDRIRVPTDPSENDNPFGID